ncbi:SCO family protein [Nocardioides caeni]|uniref:SCO family protein n=2 Tax=Nocardioides caeni TaxID=574700 RepID=A0A4S8NNT8_9ACTN|nr:SCO family protein [Nocardioides caeni]THV18580.1 SCO family protein [Nocardioides caeni]
MLLVLMALVLSGCGEESSGEFVGNRLDQPYDVPDIALTATDGSSYSLAADTDKALTLVFFGYTHCPDYCPLVMNNLSAALNRLDEGERSKVDVVFVTTDPSRDDEATLHDYLKAYDAGFIGLTGDLDDIIALGDPLHVYVNDGEKLPTGGYDLGGHSTFTLAISSDDEAVALWNQETSSTEFANDFSILLADD